MLCYKYELVSLISTLNKHVDLLVCVENCVWSLDKGFGSSLINENKNVIKMRDFIIDSLVRFLKKY